MAGKRTARDQGAGGTGHGNSKAVMRDVKKKVNRHLPREDYPIGEGAVESEPRKEHPDSAAPKKPAGKKEGLSDGTEPTVSANMRSDLLPDPSLKADGKISSNPDPIAARNGDENSDIAKEEKTRRQSPRPPEDMATGTIGNESSAPSVPPEQTIRPGSVSQGSSITDIRKKKEVAFPPESESEFMAPDKNKPPGPAGSLPPQLPITPKTKPVDLYRAVLRASEKKRRGSGPAASTTTTVDAATPFKKSVFTGIQPEEGVETKDAMETDIPSSTPSASEESPSDPAQIPAVTPSVTPTSTTTSPSPTPSAPDNPPSRLVIIHVPQIREFLNSRGGRGVLFDLMTAVSSFGSSYPTFRQRILLLGTLSQHPGLHSTSGDLTTSYTNSNASLPPMLGVPTATVPPARRFSKQKPNPQTPNSATLFRGIRGVPLMDSIPVVFIDSDCAKNMIEDDFTRSRAAANTRALRRAIVYSPANAADAFSPSTLHLTSLPTILTPHATWDVGGKARELLESWRWLDESSVVVLAKTLRRNLDVRHFEETLTKHYWWSGAVDEGIKKGKKPSNPPPPPRYPGMPLTFPPGVFGGEPSGGQGDRRDRWKEFPENVRKAVRKMEKLPGRYMAELELAELIVNPATITTTWSDIDISPRVLEAVKQVVSLSFPSTSSTSSSNDLDSASPTSYGILSHSHIPGCLLYGPPGTGKTHLARVLASSSNIVMIHASGADIVSKWVGDTEKTIQALFSLARLVAPSIIFVDEADSLFRARGPDDHGWERARVSQFLAETDGLVRRGGSGGGGGSSGNAEGESGAGGGGTGSTFLMLATNHPQSLDHAILRRVPLRLHIGLPSLASRERIFRIMLRDEELAGEGGDGGGALPASHHPGHENTQQQQQQQQQQTQADAASQTPPASQHTNRRRSPDDDITGVPIPPPTTVSLSILASSTPGFSGSDIKTLCTQAAMICQHELDRAGRPRQKRVLSMSHFHEALRRCAPTVSRADLLGIREFAREFDPNAEDGGGDGGDGADADGRVGVGSGNGSDSGGVPVLVLEARISDRDVEDGRLFW